MNFDQRSKEYREYIEWYLSDFYARFHDEPQKLLFDAECGGDPPQKQPKQGDGKPLTTFIHHYGR